MATRRALSACCLHHICHRHLQRSTEIPSQVISRNFHAELLPNGRFGFLFDIDGVIVRGKKLLPSAKEAFKLLTDEHGNFQVPALFVTNAGNTLRCSKARQLSQWLGINVEEEQVVMSHSPLKMFRQFHDKHVLINGQGPVKEIAQNLGFTRVTTVEELCTSFPHLDVMDHKRRKVAPCAFEEYFPPIEALVLFGEPVRWEMPLQILLDVLMSNGRPSNPPPNLPYPHLPVLACNMDLLWMAEAPTPRFGHGCFLHALEGLYQKITGRELKYTALTGKPSEITYHHADYLLHQQGRQLGVEGIHTIYCIGDNPETDIYGGNLYNQYLRKRALHRLQHQTGARGVSSTSLKKKLRLAQSDGEYIDDDDDDDAVVSEEQGDMGNRRRVPVIESPVDDDEEEEVAGGREAGEGGVVPMVGEVARQAVASGEEEGGGGGGSGARQLYTQVCESILVCTGVFSEDMDLFSLQGQRASNHNHRDFVINPDLKKPTHMATNVLDAVKLVLQKEGASSIQSSKT
ncbi:haloacid dehalogenase-like hydrolase domain-containing 5 [Babylonia areolata]|uniref:haloacid dehalogenase-like hydrolase domain-containing 5 n=1 Tax=Babylonia areolata TaxID=304850 RepID=UPI003FD52C96